MGIDVVEDLLVKLLQMLSVKETTSKKNLAASPDDTLTLMTP
jgi:hypothetical protein